MSNILKHAERELTLIGYDDTNQFDKMAKDAILGLIETFAKQGHSGFSGPYVVSIFNKLAKFETLSPLTGEDDEWNDVSDMSGDRKMLLQNTRDSRVFKDEKGAYFIEAIIWEDINDDVVSHFTDYDSKRYIKSFPFTPKTFYIKIDADDNILDTDEYKKANEYYY